MAANVIRVSLLADASKMKAGLKDADQAVGKTEKSMEGFGKAAVAGFQIVAASAVVAFAKDAVRAFSEVEQSAGAVEAVFGESADSIIGKADEAATEFGLSASQFQSSAALIGSMLKNQMGLSAEEAAGQVDGLIGKASDMAAVFGGTTSDAIAAIGSLMRGERDPIEKYGVSMNDAAITARALELGLADARGEIGPTAKATAALDILNEQTADSTGQFARETDTLAGSQQILAAEFENAKAALGESLAPTVSEAIGLFTDLITKLGEAEVGWQKFGGEVETATGKWKDFIGFTKEEQDILRSESPLDAWIKGLLGFEDAGHAAVRGMEDARTHGVEPLTGAIEDQAGAEGNLAGAIQTTIDIRQEAFDQMRGQIDGWFALTEAVDKQAEAQGLVNELEAANKQDTPEYVEAVKAKAEAALDVEEAELRLLTSGGLTREEFEKQRVKMKLTADEAQLLIDKYGILFTPRTVQHDIKFYTRNLGDATGRLPGTQHGGEVGAGRPRIVGEAGPEVFIPATAGRIVPNGGHSNGGGPTINLVIQADRTQALDGWKIIEALQQVERRNGPLPISVRT